MNIKNKLRDHICMYGWWNTVRMSLNRVIYRLFGFNWQRYILLGRDISSDQLFGYDFSKYDLRKVSMTDFENELWMTSFLDTTKRDLYEKRFASSSDECLGVFIDNELVCLGWNHYDELFVYGKFRIDTEQKSSYMYDDFCLPQYRGRGFHKIVNAYRMYNAAQKGAIKAYVSVALYNRPSMNNYMKAGFKEIKRFVITKHGKNVSCSLKSIYVEKIPNGKINNNWL